MKNKKINLHSFDPTEIAQNILEFSKKMIWKEGRLGVDESGKFILFTEEQTKQIIQEFKDMRALSMQCMLEEEAYGIREKLKMILDRVQ